MSKREVEVKPLALKNLTTAYEWYEQQLKGLGEDFLEELDSVINFIVLNAEGCQKRYKDFRQAMLKRFPYVVVYEIEKTKVIVYNIINTRRSVRKRFKK